MRQLSATTVLTCCLLGCGAPVDPNTPSAFAPVLEFALGQASLTSFTASTTASGLSAPRGMGTDGASTYLTADSGNNRVLIWSSLPTTTGTAANFAIGQASLTSGTAGAVANNTLNNPQNAMLAGVLVLVADTGNNRVLIWNSVPSANQVAANTVLGQAGMNVGTTNTGGISKATMSGPTYAFNDGSHVLVADTGNNRVLIWNSAAPATGAAATIVLGQPDATHSTANNSGISAKSMSAPKAVFSNGTFVAVADTGNNRVLIWNSFPSSDNQAADVVIGQPDFVSNSVISPSASTMSAPSDILYASATFSSITFTKFYVADKGFHRVLGWNGLPNVTGMGAASVWGQTNMSAAFTGDLSGPVGLSVIPNSTGISLMVADTTYNRVIAVSPAP